MFAESELLENTENEDFGIARVVVIRALFTQNPSRIGMKIEVVFEIFFEMENLVENASFCYSFSGEKLG